MIFNIFCDASIDIANKIGCGGAYIVSQNENILTPIESKLRIQLNATNNSSEIMAIWIGILEALKIRYQYPNAIFRLFSDSKISIYGLRSWMISWVKNINPNDKNNTLISSSGSIVMNQQRFIDIFNLIIENNLMIEFYHQRGHVNTKTSLNYARADFIKSNKVSPEALGINIEVLSNYNNYIDNITREAIGMYHSNKINDNTTIDGEELMLHIIRKQNLNQYVRCINKSSVVSRHDFKGGYNQ